MRIKQRIITILAVTMVIATFTPLVIPYNQIYPKLFGLPFTMWTGFGVSVLFIVLTYLASLDSPETGDHDN